MMNRRLALACLGLSLWAADAPQAVIANGPLRVKMYLPDAQAGYYRGTRFDWSGVIYSLEYQGHQFYGPWFQKTDPAVRDFVYRGADIVAGPCSAITGPVDEFGALGWDEAKPGATFVKIGVGALRKPAEGRYDHFTLYEIADPGKWTAATKPSSVEFTHELSSGGFGYLYRKTVRLTRGKPELVLEHSLKNTGARAIRTNVYNHNFLVLDQRPPGPGMTITVPFQIQTRRPPNPQLAAVHSHQIVYLKMLQERDLVTTPVSGFGTDPGDNQFRIESRTAGAGMSSRTNRPLAMESLWSIRTVVAVEPFVSIIIEPGAEFTWHTTYTYFTLPQSGGPGTKQGR